MDGDEGLDQDALRRLEALFEELEELEPSPWTVAEWLEAANSPDRRRRIAASAQIFCEAVGCRLRPLTEVRQRVLELLTDPDPGVSAAAALTLSDWDLPEAVPILLRLLPDVSVRHRAQLFRGLSGQAAPEARQALERYAAGEGEDADYARIALHWADEPDP